MGGRRCQRESSLQNLSQWAVTREPKKLTSSDEGGEAGAQAEHPGEIVGGRTH